MQQPKRWKKWASLGARIVVTFGLMAYVVSRIEWQDSLTVGSGAEAHVVHGWAETVGGEKMLRRGDELFAIPPAPEDPKTPPAYAPGFISLLRNVDLRLLAFAALLLPASFLILAVRWQWLLRTHQLDPGFLETVRLTWVGLVANNVLPSSIGGDAVKAVCISRRAPGKRVSAVMTVLMDRVLGLVALLGLGGTALLLQAQRSELETLKQYLLGALALLIIGLFVFFSGRIRSLLRVQQLLSKLPFGHHLLSVDSAVYHYRAYPRTMFAAIAASIVLHLSTVTAIAIMGRALGMRADLIHFYAFIPLIFTAGAFVPSIGGLGVLEGAFAYFFSLPFVGERASSAVALCLLYRMVQILVTLPGLYWFQAEFAKTKTAETAPSEETYHEPQTK